MESYQVDGVCYYSRPSALSAMASTMFGSGVDSSSRVYQFSTVVSGDSLVTSTTLGQSVEVSPVLQPCRLIDWQDASLLSSGVVVAIISALAVTILRRGVHE